MHRELPPSGPKYFAALDAKITLFPPQQPRKDEPSRSSYQRILLIGPLALALALARRYNWSRAAL